MPRLVQMANLWRILKEVDLEAIRRHAETPTRVLVVGETTAEADDVAAVIAGAHDEAVAWITAIDAALAARESASPAGVPAVDAPDIVVLVTRGRGASEDLLAARQTWLARHTPLLHVVLQAEEPHGAVITEGLSARLALDGLGEDAIDRLATALFSIVEPDRRVSLARQFPALRPCAFSALIEETARANAGYSFSTGLAEAVPVLGIPLTIGDIIVLTKNQLVMSYKIALAAGKQGRPRDLVGEIVGVLGGGLLFRQIARQLSGMLPVIGIVPKVAVAYGGTWAIGRTVTVWATEGRKLTGERLKQLSREGLARGREVANKMRPSP